MMDALRQDLRFALRQLRRNPGFAAVAVLTLALGIGANTAVFSVVHAVLLEPLPYPAADRLLAVWTLREEPGRAGVSPPDLLDLRRQTDAFSGLGAINPFGAPLTGEGEPVQLELGAVTADFLEVLGVRPLLGRTFRPEDDTPVDNRDTTATSTIVLGHRLWRERFGSRESVLGRTIRVGGTPMTVVGVMPPDFRLRMPSEADMPRELDAFTPLRVEMASQPRDARYLRVVGRLAPGTTLEEAAAQLELVADRLRTRHPEHAEARTRFEGVPLRENLVGHLRPPLLALLAAVGLVLLIACANVAHLLLARGAARGREVAIRAALGADRVRIARGAMAECALLAVLGGAGGLLLSWTGVELLARLAPPDLPRVHEIGLDGPVLAFTLAVSLLTTVLFGLGPSLGAARTDAIGALRGRGGTAGRRSRRVRDLLVVLEVGLSLLLLTGAGLALRSAWNLQRVEAGFRAEGALALRVDLPFARYPDPAGWGEFFTRLTDGLAERPEVESVTAADPLPLSGEAFEAPFAVRGDDPGGFGRRTADVRTVAPGYFRTMGIPLLAGREFEPGDGGGERIPVVVDEALAGRAWPGEDPVGRVLDIQVASFEDGFRLERREAEVVGLAVPVRHRELAEEGGGTIYVPHRAQPLWTMGLVVRARAPEGLDPALAAARLESTVRAELDELDPLLPVYDLRPLSEHVDRALAPGRFAAFVVALFAGAALILAAVGLYGVLSFLVRQRRGEIGIRMALGATPRRIRRLVVGRGLGLALAGLALGLVLYAALARAASGLLYGTSPLDAPTVAAVCLLMIAVSLLASWVPARRAARVDPAAPLREL